LIVYSITGVLANGSVAVNIIAADEIELIETPNGNRGAALATSSHGALEVSVIRQRQSPGGLNPPHTHDREEVMTVLAGRLRLTVEGEAGVVAAGDTAIIPARPTHKVENAGDVEAEWLLIAPAGIRFFHANGDEATPPWSK
jgi:quercetin dioxygenase-like cupin family protein